MAIIANFDDLTDPSNRARLEIVVQYVCQRHGLNRKDFECCRMMDGPNNDPFGYQVELVFKGLSLPSKFVSRLAALKVPLDDPFRGPVIRAAVPDLSRAADELLALIGQMSNPYVIRVTENEIRNLMRK